MDILNASILMSLVYTVLLLHGILCVISLLSHLPADGRPCCFHFLKPLLSGQHVFEQAFYKHVRCSFGAGELARLFRGPEFSSHHPHQAAHSAYDSSPRGASGYP